MQGVRSMPAWTVCLRTCLHHDQEFVTVFDQHREYCMQESARWILAATSSSRCDICASLVNLYSDRTSWLCESSQRMSGW